MSGPNSEYWQGVRESEDFLANAKTIEQWSEALVMLLRQHAGPAWTGAALEKALEIRKAAARVMELVLAVHPHAREGRGSAPTSPPAPPVHPRVQEKICLAMLDDRTEPAVDPNVRKGRREE